MLQEAYPFRLPVTGGLPCPSTCYSARVYVRRSAVPSAKLVCHPGCYSAKLACYPGCYSAKLACHPGCYSAKLHCCQLQLVPKAVHPVTLPKPSSVPVTVPKLTCTFYSAQVYLLQCPSLPVTVPKFTCTCYSAPLNLHLLQCPS